METIAWNNAPLRLSNCDYAFMISVNIYDDVWTFVKIEKWNCDYSFMISVNIYDNVRTFVKIENEKKKNIYIYIKSSYHKKWYKAISNDLFYFYFEIK